MAKVTGKKDERISIAAALSGVVSEVKETYVSHVRFEMPGDVYVGKFTGKHDEIPSKEKPDETYRALWFQSANNGQFAVLCRWKINRLHDNGDLPEERWYRVTFIGQNDVPNTTRRANDYRVELLPTTVNDALQRIADDNAKNLTLAESHLYDGAPLGEKEPF